MFNFHPCFLASNSPTPPPLLGPHSPCVLIVFGFTGLQTSTELFNRFLGPTQSSDQIPANSNVTSLDHSLRTPTTENKVPLFFPKIDQVCILGSVINSLILSVEEKLLEGGMKNVKTVCYFYFCSRLCCCSYMWKAEKDRNACRPFFFFHNKALSIQQSYLRGFLWPCRKKVGNMTFLSSCIL